MFEMVDHNAVESGEMHSEDDKALLEKNKKRTVKTRAQVQALEAFYSEHKYPTESMKIQLAESIGLTEKQVSGWFCHRRLKDKRLLNGDNYVTGKQDRSSGVIQDRGSGLRQDSCGSTKQVDDRNFETKEVESGRLTVQEYSAAELTYEHGGHYSGNHNQIDDASSGSSSSLRNMSNHHKGDHFDVATSRYLIPKFPRDIPGVKTRSGPSGYLKVKGQVENSAITAVKRQLGKHYREDGPPLGIEFDPLPPGAFESSMQSG
ncbi:Homeobox-DDT domain protein RLT1 [Sesamum angolense]|uniref:Homeobox-DDT domain protein RLT1 n=1 Tax=Sesamum angolense TaxID=2727404 RepID=A0AAE1X907_9LAMI|nr:Homeobox-DDT domain protein RLT1 [Sesamum angolense]